MCACCEKLAAMVGFLLILLVMLSWSPVSESAKLPPGRLHPAGVDFFEHEFISVPGADSDYDPYGPDIGNDDLGIDDPETMPRLFQGDIAIDPYTYITLRLGVNPMRHPKRLWPNGTIPFEISSRYVNRERESIMEALKTFNSLTCIKFVPYDGEVEDYLLIEPPEEGPQGCWSYVGKRGGEQVVSLQRPDSNSAHCFSSEGRIMHELMHAIGIYHEQSRADRDNFVKIHWENIVPRFRKNFKLISRKRGKYSFDYDYNSVMHYGEFYFSKEGRETHNDAATAGCSNWPTEDNQQNRLSQNQRIVWMSRRKTSQNVQDLLSFIGLVAIYIVFLHIPTYVYKSY